MLGSTVSNQKLRYVKAFKDRWGTQRYYFRRKGCPATTLYGEPGSAEFQAGYEAALSQVPQHRARSGLERGCIYVIRIRGYDLAKIGYSTDPERRLRQLADGAGMTGGMEIIYRCNARRVLERQIHAQLAEVRLFGEWFRLSGPLEEWIARREAEVIEREQRLEDAGVRPRRVAAA